MKRMVNMTTSSDDMGRFGSRRELLDLIRGFDGIELMCFEDDMRCIIDPEHVIGLHMGFYHYWVDFWNGDTEALIREYGSLEQVRESFGGTDRQTMVDRFRSDLETARRYNAEYLVFHVSDASIRESFTWQYRHTSKEVVSAACELINAVFSGVDPDDGPILLLENLWQPGLDLLDPDMARRLLNGIDYTRCGFMLDTGHLLHTKLDLNTQEEGVAYIHHVLDGLGQGLVDKIYGMHLNQSITGAYSRSMFDKAPAQGISYNDLVNAMFAHVYQVDKHLPFTGRGIKELVARINPDYLTYEFITDNNETHRSYLDAQNAALGL